MASNYKDDTMHILSVIDDTHALPLHQRPMKKLIDPPAGIANPVYEIEEFLRDRVILNPPKHDGVRCDNSKCSDADAGDNVISGLRYHCVDCVPDSVDFCSTCVALPGQGTGHASTHRLLQLLATECSICQGTVLLGIHEDGVIPEPYKEYSASGAAFNRVSKARSCAFCTFVWNALLQYPLHGIQWPPSESQEVKIRVRMPFSDWLEIAVVSDAGQEQRKLEVEICGEMYTIRTQNRGDVGVERALQVGRPLRWSHQTSINTIVSNDDHSEEPRIAKVQQNSGSDESLLLAKMWLDNCRERHISCNDLNSDLIPPIRLIDILGKDSSRVYLRETKGETCEYAALSYCWGPDAPGLFTSNTNFTSYCEDGIEIGKLPRTIQEAIFAVRTLGLRSLWVDRLCIIQDSKDDWTHQAALMCAVYSGASLTLSADGSDCATKGLFHTDQALSKLDYNSYCGLDGDDTMLVLVEPQKHLPLVSRLLTPSQPIDSRGWTLQERLMSRRVLHFTSEEMVWECDTLTECECRRQSGASQRELSTRSLQEAGNPYIEWRLIAQAYAMRSLQYDSDKMPALRGLVEKFQDLLRDISSADSEPPDEYLAGLWKGDLVAQLAWKPPSKADREDFKKAVDRRTAEIENMREPSGETAKDWQALLQERIKHEDWHESEVYIAPSWSWAHLRGPMSYHFCIPSSPFVPYAEVVEARVKPVNPDEPTGMVSSGSITLDGHMVRGMEYWSFYGAFEDVKLTDLCWLTNEIDYDGYDWYIWFDPDDCTGLMRRRGPHLSGVILFLLGTQDLNPPKQEKGISINAAPPVELRKCRREAQAGDLETGVDSLDIASSPLLVEELLEVFRRDGQDRPLHRWSSFLVLVESEQQRGKYERIGCFDVYSGDQAEILGTLFRHSTKEQITII